MSGIDELRQKRILIADDDRTNAIDVKAMLAEGGFGNIETAYSGHELMERLQGGAASESDRADLVLVSNTMGDLDAYEFCRSHTAHEDWSGVLVVIMVEGDGWWDEETARRSYEAGAVDVMFRPLRGMEIVPRILLALGLQQERDQRLRQQEELGTELAERKVMEARLQYLVAHDDLTGLFNRRRLEQSLDLAIIRCRNFSRSGALLYVDLDRFKVVNDTDGHEAGDRLLTGVANLLRRQVSQSEVIARTGSDEFAILLENLSGEDAMRTAEEIRRALDECRFEGAPQGGHLCASIGVAVIRPEEKVNASEVLARADQACYVAKQHGRNVVHRFSPEDVEVHTLRSDVQWVPRIRKALSEDRFFLVFQPVVRMSDGRATHYEVLLRMRGDHPGEVYLPEEFIPVAERMGLIHHIDLWVVEHAIDFLAALPQEQSHVSLNVNLSGHAFQDPSLLPLVKQKLDMLWVSAGRLIFEITETAAVANFVQTREMVARLRALGCRFALDDFGSGFNSFNYIKNFPVDYLKIDGTFIINLLNDPTDQVLVKSMIDIARSLGKKTVAEYVESAEILDILRRFGVDYVQGFHLGRPETALLAGGPALPANSGPRPVPSETH